MNLTNLEWERRVPGIGRLTNVCYYDGTHPDPGPTRSGHPSGIPNLGLMQDQMCGSFLPLESASRDASTQHSNAERRLPGARIMRAMRLMIPMHTR